MHAVFEFGNDDHNCIGCNLADSVDHLRAFLETHETQKRIKFAYPSFIIHSYLLVERIDTLFNIIQLHQSYRDKNFKVLMAIRRWANFIKHPKAFIRTHHAVFTFSGSAKFGDLSDNATVTINRAFIDKYYCNNDNNDDLIDELENKENVLVVFPDANYVTEKLCEALKKTIDLFENNEVYREILGDSTTFHDYWFPPPS